MSFLSLAIDRGQPDNLGLPLLLTEGNGFYSVTNRTGSISLQFQKRDAYPRTYCRQIASDTIVFGYGDEGQQDSSEFLSCTLTAAGELDIIRDAFGTLPLFYSCTSDFCIVTNSYPEIVSLVPNPKLSHPDFMEALAGLQPMPGTYIENVSVLWPDERLTYQAGNSELARMATRTWMLSSDVPETDPHTFRRYFDDYLTYFITSRLQGQNSAFEVSGGLDSATLPQFHYKVSGRPVVMAALIHSEGQRAYQQKKLHAIAEATAGELLGVVLDPEIHFPLARMVNTQTWWPTYFEKTYEEPTREFVRQLALRGTTVLCTGVGGDELFGNNVKPSHMRPLRRMSRSVDYNALCNTMYIEEGIWPVSPFTNPEMYTWIQGLPVHYRTNKNILRAWHQAHHFVPDIYSPRHANETFEGFFATCFSSGKYDDIIQKAAKQSVAAEYHYLDLARLLGQYEKAKAHVYPEREADLFATYLWLLAEINAQSS